MPTISIIITIFNHENNLPKCLDSVINQTFQDIEIICINQGSTDNSYKILKKYANKDSRITIINQNKCNIGKARNIGLENANGKYIAFLNGNDRITNDYYEKLHNAIEEDKVNIASNKKNFFGTFSLHSVEKKCFYGANDILKNLQQNYYVTGMLFKFEPIKNLRFKEDVLCEDVSYLLKAIDLSTSMVTVPNVTYYSNKTKIKIDEKLKNDIIETRLDAIKYANEHNIKYSNLIYDDKKNFFRTKTYLNKKDFYVCGIKIFSKRANYNEQRIFVVILLACFGDILVRNALFQNIKTIFPNSKTVFIVDKPWEDVARYSKDVDEVFIYDKKGEHHNILGMLNFVKKFPYKNIDYLFCMNASERVRMLAYFLRPKMRATYLYGKKVQEKCISCLANITNKPIVNYPIQYQPDIILPERLKHLLNNSKRYVALCTISKLPEKDMPVETAIELVKNLNNYGIEVIYTGVGKKSQDYAKQLEDSGCKILNLVDSTTIPELACILKECEALISVDTGTMHLGYAMKVPTICIFYKLDTIDWWAPDENVYKNVKVISSDFSAKNIYNSTKEFLKEVVYE